MEKIILASGSPRRKELLEQAGISFTIKVSEADETITKKEPWEAVMELAARKARAVAESGLEEEDVIVIGADTVVAVDGKILGKPHSKEEAEEMLRFFPGECIRSALEWHFFPETREAGESGHFMRRPRWKCIPSQKRRSGNMWPPESPWTRQEPTASRDGQPFL